MTGPTTHTDDSTGMQITVALREDMTPEEAAVMAATTDRLARDYIRHRSPERDPVLPNDSEVEDAARAVVRSGIQIAERMDADLDDDRAARVADELQQRLNEADAQ